MYEIKTALPGPKSKELIERKEECVPTSISPLAPFIVEEGKGALVKDMDGNWFIDFTGGWGCLIVGHAHPRVVEAVRDQAGLFLHTDFSAVMYAPYIELAERLSKLAPGPSPKKVAFFNSGAEAIENAVKIARAYTKRKAIVVFENAFHGRTLLTMTMTHKAQPYKGGFGPFASDVYRVPFPHPYRTNLTFKEIERIMVNSVAPEEVAALVVEPIQGEGGFIVPPRDFLPFLRQMTRKYDILMVADEIQTGFGRTGKLFACEHVNVEPDMITLAKSIAAGLPLSGVIGRKEVMDAPSDSSIGGTFAGNPVACRAALAVLDVIAEENLLERANEIGDHVMNRFQEMRERFKIIGDVRGIGAMIAMELVRDREAKEPAVKETTAIVREAIQNGAIFAKAGLYSNVIRLLLPLVTTDEQLEKGLDALEKAIATVTA